LDAEPAGSQARTRPLRCRFVAPTPDELAPAFPQFEILALLGQGGMGVVHRDIKPENVLLAERPAGSPATHPSLGLAKIADFGLARLVEPDPADFTLTSPEHMLGTPAYMAPEQIERPHETDHRADLYALGAMLYEMLTGELPLGRFAPISHKVDIDPRLDALVLRCLAKSPGDRYEQAAEVKDRLAAIFVSTGGRGEGLLLVEPRAVRRRVAIAAVVALSILILAAAVALAWQVTRVPKSSGPWAASVSRATEMRRSPPRSVPLAGAMNESAPTGSPKRPSVHETEGDRAAGAGGSAAAVPPAKEPPQEPTPAATAEQPEVELSNAKLMGGIPQHTLRIDYKFRPGARPTGLRYVWVIESADGTEAEQSLSWNELSTEGTLRTSFTTFGFRSGPYETWFEVEQLGAFRSRRRISNIVKLESQGRWGMVP